MFLPDSWDSETPAGQLADWNDAYTEDTQPHETADIPETSNGKGEGSDPWRPMRGKGKGKNYPHNTIPGALFLGALRKTGTCSVPHSPEDLKKYFSQYGPVKDVSIIRGDDGVEKGAAFLQFEGDSTPALHALTQAVLNSAPHTVDGGFVGVRPRWLEFKSKYLKCTRKGHVYWKCGCGTNNYLKRNGCRGYRCKYNLKMADAFKEARLSLGVGVM